MSTDDRNIEFLPNKVKYNAITKFKQNIVKIPSYVVTEIMNRQLRVEIYHEGVLEADYSTTEFSNAIRNVEKKEYNGKFRNTDIKYRLNHVRV